MKVKFLIGLCLVLAAVMPEFVYAHDRDSQKERQQRTEWNREMLQAKIDFMSRELKLTDQQKEKFGPAFESMDRETSKLFQQTRSMTKSVYDKGEKATDLEREKAAEAMFEMKSKEGEIEMKYYKKFKEILTPQQIFEYKNAERKFNKELMKHHRKASKK